MAWRGMTAWGGMTAPAVLNFSQVAARRASMAWQSSTMVFPCRRNWSLSWRAWRKLSSTSLRSPRRPCDERKGATIDRAIHSVVASALNQGDDGAATSFAATRAFGNFFGGTRRANHAGAPAGGERRHDRRGRRGAAGGRVGRLDHGRPARPGGRRRPRGTSFPC